VPQYLHATALEHGLMGELIPAANRINETMPRLVVDKLERALGDYSARPLMGANILLVGITYKPDIADVRESAALRVLEEATRRGAKVEYFDPLMPTVAVDGEVVVSVDLETVDFTRVDAVVLLTPHTAIDYDRIIAAARLVVDTHSGLQPREAPNVVNIWIPAMGMSEVRHQKSDGALIVG
jgi:UDP-N-acetyl-D-glucosamine dehydrogenase